MHTPGKIVEGVITGIQPYGAFVYIDEYTSGLIHISELSEFYVRDIHQYVQVGDRVLLKIIDVDEQNKQLRLSLKAARSSSLRRQRKQHRFAKVPDNLLGFATLAKMLPSWIQQAKEEDNND